MFWPASAMLLLCRLLAARLSDESLLTGVALPVSASSSWSRNRTAVSKRPRGPKETGGPAGSVPMSVERSERPGPQASPRSAEEGWSPLAILKDAVVSLSAPNLPLQLDLSVLPSPLKSRNRSESRSKPRSSQTTSRDEQAGSTGVSRGSKERPARVVMSLHVSVKSTSLRPSYPSGAFTVANPSASEGIKGSRGGGLGFPPRANQPKMSK
mmetsp:Transcript_89134/g.226706  ORF Transcript_89134/g.226706 Transcript_89134/m.226706 type:complete len:211 (+) Transcript_89134:1809-2441(+)